MGQRLWHFVVEMKHLVSIRLPGALLVLALLVSSLFPGRVCASVSPPKSGSFFRAPYLNPTIGRFWTMDTYEGNQSDPLSLHKYLYCHANPINGTDPSGHEFNLTGMQIATAISITINIDRFRLVSCVPSSIR